MTITITVAVSAGASGSELESSDGSGSELESSDGSGSVGLSDGSLRDTVTGDEDSPPPTAVTACI